jgi:DnaK suppressor protein
MNPNEHKKRYSDADLQEFRELIDKKLEIARHELVYLQEQLLEINEEADAIKAGNFDEGSQNYEREHLAKMIQRTQDFIRNLEFALVRIQNKTYGVCTVTGELIDKKRLLLVPHTTKSIEGKSIEQKQAAQQPKMEHGRSITRAEIGKKILSKTPAPSKKGGSGKMEEWDEEEMLGDFEMDDMPIDDLEIPTETTEPEQD